MRYLHEIGAHNELRLFKFVSRSVQLFQVYLEGGSNRGGVCEFISLISQYLSDISSLAYMILHLLTNCIVTVFLIFPFLEAR